MKILILFTILGLLQSSNSYAWDSNAIFSGGSLNAAKEKAEKENKLLILKFTAKWCLPCRHMEKNVFLNKEVQKFSEQHAIIFQIDIDENKNLKEEFKIEVLPTVILMKSNGIVISRREESFNAESFVFWLDKNKDLNPLANIPITKEQASERPLFILTPLLDTKPIEKDIQMTLASLNDGANTIIESDKNYFVQAGVFTLKVNAENMVALLKINYQEEIAIVEETKDNIKYFKVRVGYFTNKDEAEIFRQILEKNNFKAIVRSN